MLYLIIKNVTKLAASNPQRIIPLHNFNMDVSNSDLGYSEAIFSGIIDGLTICHKCHSVKGKYPLKPQKDCAVFLIVLKGNGLLTLDDEQQTLEKESLVVIPNETRNIAIELDEGESLHFLEFSKVYSEEDKMNIRSSEMPLDKLYTARFQDCEPYKEEIKSPSTISRTVLPSNIIPRVALGTVESMGPDKVDEHSHPMLEQLFIGLEDNAITVYADNAICKMGEFSILHIPLGSTHCVEVAEHCRMNYMWMDFFLTKAGEVWLDTHKAMDEDETDTTTP